MSSPLSEVDRELLGEDSNTNGAEATLAKANDGPSDGSLEDSHGFHFTPINAAAGTLVQMSGNGEGLEAGNGHKDTNAEDTESTPKTPKKRGVATAANDDSAQPAKKRSVVKKSTAATDGDATEPTTTPKKRASPKKKNTADVKVKNENGETDGETEGQEPVTPKKGKRTSAKAKGKEVDNGAKTSGDSAELTDMAVSPAKGNGGVEGMTAHNTPRKRQAPKKEITGPRGIPTSWENADNADRMMVTMKEKGEGWAEIRAAWKKETGQDTAPSTLPNRYNRIKVNMLRMKQGDETHLLAAKKEIEDSYATNFWANVAANMERRGADKYPAAFIQKTFKELETTGNINVNGAASTSTAPSAPTGAIEDVAMKEEDTAGDLPQ